MSKEPEQAGQWRALRLYGFELPFFGLWKGAGCVALGWADCLPQYIDWWQKQGFIDPFLQEAFLRSEYIEPDMMEHVLAALMPANALALRVSMATGLRISDVLELKTLDVERGRFTVREGKTGKTRRIRLPAALQVALLKQAGHVYAFPARSDGRKHRTRQAVYKDIRRAAAAFRLKEHVSPHSARKMFAVASLKRYGDLKKVQQLLNHESEAVTLIYVLADELTRRHKHKK